MRRTGFLAVALFGAITVLCACQNAETHTNAMVPNKADAPAPSPSVKKDKREYPKIAAVYVLDQKFIKFVVFYESGEWGKFATYTDTDEKEPKTFHPDGHDMYQYGSWESAADGIKITIKKCHCTDCAESESPDLSDEELKDPLPVSENWKMVKGKFGVAGSVLKASKDKYILWDNKDPKIGDLESTVPFMLFQLKEMGNVIARCKKSDLKDF